MLSLVRFRRSFYKWAKYQPTRPHTHTQTCVHAHVRIFSLPLARHVRSIIIAFSPQSISNSFFRKHFIRKGETKRTTRIFRVKLNAKCSGCCVGLFLPGTIGEKVEGRECEFRVLFTRNGAKWNAIPMEQIAFTRMDKRGRGSKRRFLSFNQGTDSSVNNRNLKSPSFFVTFLSILSGR